MNSLTPYINFAGKCREALAFYQQCFDGQIMALQTFGDVPEQAQGQAADNIMHAEFKAKGIYFIASDGFPGMHTAQESNISLYLNLESMNELTRLFHALTESSLVSMPLQDLFWGERFCDLTDRFGVQWLLNCNSR